MQIRRVPALLVCVMVLLGVLGCGGPPAERTGGHQVTDAARQTIVFDEKPMRILNYAFWLDDIVLGLVPPERLVGIDHLADDPNSSNIVGIAEQIPVKLNQPSAEKVMAMRPDVVFLDAGRDAAVAESLRDLGIRVVACEKPRSADEVRTAVRLVAAALGEEEKGAALITAYDAECQALAARVAVIPPAERKTVLVISMSPTFGSKGGLFDHLCTMAGVVNGAAEIGLEAGQSLTKEHILAVNPDVLIVPVWNDHGSYDINKFNREYLDDPALQTVQAIRTQRIVRPHEGYIYNASQDMVFGAQDIAHLAYGELIEQPVGRHLTVAE